MAQSKVKIKTAYPGVRYREHPTRKHGAVNKDRYFFIRYKVNGKDKEEGVGWSKADKMTPEKAAAILSEIRENIRLGKGPQSLAEMRAENEAAEIRKKELEDAEAKRKISFGQFFDDTYMPNAERDKSDNSIESEKGLYNKWISPVLKDVCLKDIQCTHIDKILNNMSNENRSKRTMQYALAVISQVWQCAINYKIVNGESPIKQREITKLDNERSGFLSIEQAVILLDELKKHSIDVHDCALMSLLCGLRSGEIFNLKWSDINFDEKTIKLSNTKSSKTRYAYILPEIEEMLKERLKSRASNTSLIFPAKNGKTHERISNTFNRVIKNLGFNENVVDRKDKIVFHSLRHTFASWQAINGTHPYDIMKLMGHSSFKVMQRYAHLTDMKLKNDAMSLSGLLSKQNNEINNKENDETK